MDLKDFEEEVFNSIKADYLDFAAELDTGDLTFIPMSALKGDNVVNPSEKMPWYSGPTLMATLETVKVTANRNFDDFRFPVQYVNRPNLNFRGYCGTIASGIVRKGDVLTVLPSGKSSKVKSIVTQDEELEMAHTPMAVTITLEDEIDISRGDLLTRPDNMPGTSDTVFANIVWMSESVMQPGKLYDFKHTTRALSGTVSAIEHKIDINTLDQLPGEVLQLNEIGLCEITFNRPIHFDPYKQNSSTGSFIIIDRLTNVTVGAGMIAGEIRSGRKSIQHKGHVTDQERAARYGQQPVTVMFIGLSGAGKSTLAHALERRLFDMGKLASVLDGKAMRLGISRDLPHDAAGRAENLRRSANIAKYLNDNGLICCAAFVAASEEAREHAISVIGRERCIVVYLNPPLGICKQRDPSGLYAAESNSESSIVPGVSFPYEAPEQPELILPTHELDESECIARVLNLLRERSVF
jgi:bifunctional enzyme CysN/CysC